MRSELLDFRYINVDDEPDARFDDGLAWSRVYEYPLALRFLESVEPVAIHNTSWGFEGIHVVFKEALDERFDVLHSDRRPSDLPRTAIYDITTEAPAWAGRFDVVLSISTLEEVAYDP